MEPEDKGEAAAPDISPAQLREPEPVGDRAARRAWRKSVMPERVAYVERQLVGCVAHQVIERRLSKQWKVTSRTIRNYIRRVYDEWHRRAMEDPADHRTQLVLALSEVYRKAMMDGQYRAAVAALERIGRLNGLFTEEARLRVEGRVAHLHAQAAQSTMERTAIDSTRAALRRLPQEELDVLGRIYEQLSRAEPAPALDGPESDRSGAGAA